MLSLILQFLSAFHGVAQMSSEIVVKRWVRESGIVDDNNVAISAQFRVILLERFQEYLCIVRILFKMRVFNLSLSEMILELRRFSSRVSRLFEVQQSTADNDGRFVQRLMWN